MGAVAAVAERGRVRLSNDTEESISLVPTLFVAVIFGPLAGMTVAAASMIGQFGRPYLKWATFTSSRALTGAAVGFVSVAVRGTTDHLAAVALATTVGAVAAQLLDTAFALTVRKLRGKQAGDLLRAIGPPVIAAIPLYAPVVALLAFAFENVSPWTLPLFFAPALAAQRLFGLYQDQRRLATDLASANTQLEEANVSFATALVATLDARDRYTAGHSAAVAIYARDIAAQLGLTPEEQQLAHLCGLVHDIGKIGLPPGLLEKPGALSLDERRQMERHSEIGERILRKVKNYSEIATIVRHHHERWDGQGYPDRIAGDAVPLLARIIAVADAYNAMTSDRPYRDAMPYSIARLRLNQSIESQFDPSIVAAFDAVLEEKSPEYRAGTGAEFAFGAQERRHQSLARVA
jgi:putative nucleotidyltransferase with HDIG domain